METLIKILQQHINYDNIARSCMDTILCKEKKFDTRRCTFGILFQLKTEEDKEKANFYLASIVKEEEKRLFFEYIKRHQVQEIIVQKEIIPLFKKNKGKKCVMSPETWRNIAIFLFKKGIFLSVDECSLFAVKIFLDMSIGDNPFLSAY